MSIYLLAFFSWMTYRHHKLGLSYLSEVLNQAVFKDVCPWNRRMKGNHNISSGKGINLNKFLVRCSNSSLCITSVCHWYYTYGYYNHALLTPARRNPCLFCYLTHLAKYLPILRGWTPIVHFTQVRIWNPVVRPRREPKEDDIPFSTI